MTKKDYIIIANALKDIKRELQAVEDNNIKLSAQDTMQVIISRIGNELGLDNEKFNYTKFVDYINK